MALPRAPCKHLATDGNENRYMHPNPKFRSSDRARILRTAEDRGFGALVVGTQGYPLLAHVPFILTGNGAAAEAHLVRSNPIVALLDEPRPAVLAVTGSEAYVSPDWYGLADQVPTWNYIAVHLRGHLHAQPAEALRGHLERLSHHFETRLAPKPVWTLDKLSDAVLGRLMRMIVPVRLEIEEVDGTWKLGQNKPPEAIRGAAAGIVEAGAGVWPEGLAHLMMRLADAAEQQDSGAEE